MFRKSLLMLLGLVLFAGVGYAATNASTYGEALPANSNFFHAQIEVDADALTVPSDGTVQLMKVPAGTLVTYVHAEVDTAEGEACYVGVGDGNDVDRFVTDLDANGTNIEDSTGNTMAFLYESADTVDLLFASDTSETAMQADTAVVTVTILGAKVQ